MRAVGRHPSVSCWIKASNSPGPGAGIGTSTTDVLLWSDNMFRLLGFEPGEITPTPDYVPQGEYILRTASVLSGSWRRREP